MHQHEVHVSHEGQEAGKITITQAETTPRCWEGEGKEGGEEN